MAKQRVVSGNGEGGAERGGLVCMHTGLEDERLSDEEEEDGGSCVSLVKKRQSLTARGGTLENVRSLE